MASEKRQKTAVVQFRTKPEVRDAIAKAAAKDDRTISYYVERAMIAHLRDRGYLPDD